MTSSTTFPDDKDALLAGAPKDRSVDIGRLDGHDLLDPNIYLDPLSFPTATDERVNKSGGWDTGYLDWVRRSVVGPSA